MAEESGSNYSRGDCMLAGSDLASVWFAECCDVGRLVRTGIRRPVVAVLGPGARHTVGLAGRCQLVDTVLEQADFHPISVSGLGVVAVRRRQLGIAQAHHENAVHRNVILFHQVTDHRIRHGLRTLDTGLATRRREALHFDDVALLVLQVGGHVVQGLLGFRAQGALSRTETDLGLGRGLILIDVADHLLHGIQTIAGLERSLVGLLCLAARFGGVLVSFGGLGGRLADALLRTRVDILDLLGVLRGEIVEFVHPIADRAELPLYVLLAGEGIDLAPKALAIVRLQWLARREVLIGTQVLIGTGRLRRLVRARSLAGRRL